MIKNNLIIALLLASGFANAQYKTIDALLIVKNYIQTIQGSIPKKEKEVADKIKALDSLTHLGTQKKIFFDQQLQIILKDNPEEIKELLKQYDLVLQSAIVVKTDLKHQLFETNETKKEMQYLNKSSAYLIDKIYFYANHHKNKTLEKKH